MFIIKYIQRREVIKIYAIMAKTTQDSQTIPIPNYFIFLTMNLL